MYSQSMAFRKTGLSWFDWKKHSLRTERIGGRQDGSKRRMIGTSNNQMVGGVGERAVGQWQ